MSHRIKRVGIDIQHCIAHHLPQILSFKKYLLKDMISLTKVNMSRDLRTANFYVIHSHLSKVESTTIISELKTLQHLFSKVITENVRLKYIPKIVFHYDYSFEKMEQVDWILHNIGSA